MRFATDISSRIITTLLVVMQVVVGLSLSIHSVEHLRLQHHAPSNCSGDGATTSHFSHDSRIVAHDDFAAPVELHEICTLCTLTVSGTVALSHVEDVSISHVILDWVMPDATIVLRDIHRSFSPRSPPVDAPASRLA